MESISSFFSDIWDSFVNGLKDLLASGCESCLNKALEVLNMGVKASGENGGFLDQLLAKSPVEFSAGGPNTIWSSVQTICENAVVPIAAIILVIILLTDLIQMVISGNNFKDFDTSVFFKWIFKSVCGILLVSNVFYISTGIFALGTQVTTAALGSNRDVFDIGTKTIHISAARYDFGTLFSMMFISFLIMLVLYLVIAVIIIALCSRMIEVFMYLGASPLPMATFMNPEWKQMGHNWLRGMLSLAFQGLFIVISLTILSTLFRNNIQTLDRGGDILSQLAFLLGYSLAAIFTILRSGQISKSIFGAH